MSNPQAVPPTPSATIPLADILGAISNPARWNLLRELASGESLMVSELAERVGQSLDTASKNMAILRKAGIVIQGRNRLYSLAPQFIANKTDRIIDFGYCLLRMNVGAEQQRRDAQPHFPFRSAKGRIRRGEQNRAHPRFWILPFADERRFVICLRGSVFYLLLEIAEILRLTPSIFLILRE